MHRFLRLALLLCLLFYYASLMAQSPQHLIVTVTGETLVPPTLAEVFFTRKAGQEVPARFYKKLREALESQGMVPLVEDGLTAWPDQWPANDSLRLRAYSLEPFGFPALPPQLSAQPYLQVEMKLSDTAALEAAMAASTQRLLTQARHLAEALAEALGKKVGDISQVEQELLPPAQSESGGWTIYPPLSAVPQSPIIPQQIQLRVTFSVHP